MLRKLDKNFCTSLKQACKKNTTLNDTLKKYKTLKQLIRTRRSQLIKGEENKESEDFHEELLSIADSFVKNNFSTNECWLLLAIYAIEDIPLHHLESSGFAPMDIGNLALMKYRY